MCIIIAKYKNGRLPKKTELKNSFEYNSDGAGFMYVDNGKVIIDKGYMKYEDFINRFDKLCKKYDNFNNKSLIIHCRIGTSSSNTAENTHPYPITKKEKYLHAKYIKADLGVAHNGIISEYTPNWKNPTTNDTQEFIMKYLAPLYKNYKEFYKNKYIMNGIKNIINSKLAFLDTSDHIYFVGKENFIEEEKGLFFSNNTYQYSIKDYDYNYNYNYNYLKLYNKDKEKNIDYLEKYKDYYDYEDYYNVCDENGEDLKYIVYDDELEFLQKGDYISKGIDNFEEIKDENIAYDICYYNLYEIVGDKAYLIGNLMHDNIELYTKEYERIV